MKSNSNDISSLCACSCLPATVDLIFGVHTFVDVFGEMGTMYASFIFFFSFQYLNAEST